MATRITFICPMTFNSFPLDVQVCLFQVHQITLVKFSVIKISKKSKEQGKTSSNPFLNTIHGFQTPASLRLCLDPGSIRTFDETLHLLWFQFDESFEWFQVGSFNYDNTKMVFNDSFIAEEGAIRSFIRFSAAFLSLSYVILYFQSTILKCC